MVTERRRRASTEPPAQKTVTFLFTDIEGSTGLAERLGPGFKPVLEAHRDLIRHAVAEAGGTEVSTGGDSFFVTFSSAARAVQAALAAQRALTQHTWPPDAELRVRMGIHTGEATEVAGDFVGLEVHRAARIADAAHGGQIVLSGATWTIVREAVEGVEYRDLGEHRLKDLARAERVLQVVAPDLPADFPPLRSLNAIPNNLPMQLTSFVGRTDVVAEAKRLLAGSRALTLTGPGGTGKTRLALQLAADVLGEFRGGAYFVGLAPVSDPSLVAPTIAQTLGLQQSATMSIVDALVDHLRDKQVLLVLDNFEHVLPAAPVVSVLLRASPSLKVIVTSRSVLHVSGEQELEVPALSLPPADGHAGSSPEILTQYEAVALFIERAVAVKPDFRVTNDNAAAIAAICVRLDGLPLAIELAAARVKLLPPHAMLARLEHSLGVLVTGRADLPDRQRTLRNAIGWSHDLLDPSGRRLFARFGTFVGGARLEEIELVCGSTTELGIDVLEGVAALVDQSLVRQTEESGEARFTMLETIREFALERLAEAGEEASIRARHALAYLELAERAEKELMGPAQRAWLDRLESEHGNLRSAIAWAVDTGGAEVALRIGASIWRFWQMRGYLNEARERLDTVLALPELDKLPHWLAKAHEAAGGVAYWQGDFDRSREHYEVCLSIHRELGDEAGEANDLYNLVFTRIVGLIEQADSEEGQRNADWARGLLNASLDIYRRLGDERGIAKVMWGIGSVEFIFEPEVGKQAFLESLRLYRKLGDRFGVGWSLRELGVIEQRAGNHAAARNLMREALELFDESHDISGVTLLLNDLSRVEMALGRVECGARLAGAAAALQATTGTDLAATINEVFESVMPADVDPASLRTEWEAGQQLTLEQAISLALTDPATRDDADTTADAVTAS